MLELYLEELTAQIESGELDERSLSDEARSRLCEFNLCRKQEAAAIEAEKRELEKLLGPAPTPDKVRAVAKEFLRKRVLELTSGYFGLVSKLTEVAGLNKQETWGLTEYAVENSLNTALYASEGDELTIKSVNVLADALLDDNRHALRRIVDAARPSVNARSSREAVVQAVSIIESRARSHTSWIAANKTAAREEGSPPEWMAERLAYGNAGGLIVDLSERVHVGFMAIYDSESGLASVDGLLARFSAGKARNAKRGEPSKLAAAGILVRLNKMARSPLGTLAVGTIGNMVKESRMRNGQT